MGWEQIVDLIYMLNDLIFFVMATVAFALAISIYFAFKASPYGKVMLPLSLFIMFMIPYYGLQVLITDSSDFELLYEISELIAFIFMFITGIQLKRTFVGG